jgi:hypothetical protein
MPRIVPGLSVVALYLLTIATAVAQDGAPEPVVAMPPGAATAIPWVTGALSIISTVVLLIREARSTIDKIHGCQPTVRVLHTYEACPKCGTRPGDHDEPRTGEEPRPAVRAVTSA